MTSMKVALVALSVRGAMGQYLEALSKELSNLVELHVFIPRHFTGFDVSGSRLSMLATVATRPLDFLRLLSCSRLGGI